MVNNMNNSMNNNVNNNVRQVDHSNQSGQPIDGKKLAAIVAVTIIIIVLVLAGVWYATKYRAGTPTNTTTDITMGDTPTHQPDPATTLKPIDPTPTLVATTPTPTPVPDVETDRPKSDIPGRQPVIPQNTLDDLATTTDLKKLSPKIGMTASELDAIINNPNTTGEQLQIAKSIYNNFDYSMINSVEFDKHQNECFANLKKQGVDIDPNNSVTAKVLQDCFDFKTDHIALVVAAALSPGGLQVDRVAPLNPEKGFYRVFAKTLDGSVQLLYYDCYYNPSRQSCTIMRSVMAPNANKFFDGEAISNANHAFPDLSQ